MLLPDSLHHQICTDLKARYAVLPSDWVSSHLQRLSQLPPDRPDLAQLIRWIYWSTPLSDWFTCDFSLYQKWAEQGLFLRDQVAYTRALPLDLFLNDVVQGRVNDEALVDCRGFFYDQIAPLIQPENEERTLLALNHWCAQQVRYQSTDIRTLSPLATFNSGFGRCGEESVFAVNVFRSAGLAARQVYAPRWAHCDDNHAWVEVWCSGKWRFLGACEPEEVLDKGWFNQAASRAFLVVSRIFCPQVPASEEVAGTCGQATLLNQTSRYAPTRSLRITVKDREDRPCPGARVTVGLLNFSEIAPVATFTTDAEGKGTLTCGRSSCWVRAQWENGLSEEVLVDREQDVLTLVVASPEMSPEPIPQADFLRDQSRETIPSPSLTPSFLRQGDQAKSGFQKAPVDGLQTTPSHASDQEKQQKVHKKEDDALYQQKCQYLNRKSAPLENLSPAQQKRAEKLLSASQGHRPALESLLRTSKEPKGMLALLETLSQKDLRDVSPAVLEDALDSAPRRSDVSEDLYWRWVACPRVWMENLFPCRKQLLQELTLAQQAEFAIQPAKAFRWVQEQFPHYPQWEYDSLITSPAALIRSQTGSPLSQKILWVTLCRSLGVPSRLNPLQGHPEYWEDGRFQPASGSEEDFSGLTLRTPGHEAWVPGTDFSLGRWDGERYQTVNLEGADWTSELTLLTGYYRLWTTQRLPNGDVHFDQKRFFLGSGQQTDILLEKTPLDPKDLFVNFKIEDRVLKTLGGQEARLSKVASKPALVAFIRPGEEPTEHLLNELLEQSGNPQLSKLSLCLILPEEDNHQMASLRQRLNGLENLQWLLEPHWDSLEGLSRRLYVDPDQKPLVMLFRQTLQVCAVAAGYSVGRIAQFLRLSSYLGDGIEK